MLTIDPKEVSVPKLHGYLLGAIVPRPIGFVSSIDKSGNVNLSPFSFFNAFGANPPTLVFSPARRVRDNTTKHTLENALEHPEVVINTVDYAMVEQMSLSSTEYKKGINEFVKSGLTMADSLKVKPPRVAESPASFECIVKDVISLGQEGGAGNLVICEILLAHFQDRILDDDQRIDPGKIDAVARLGGDWYSRVTPESLFEIEKPVKTKGIGVDQIPVEIRNSAVLTGNDLGRLGNVEKLPDTEAISEFGLNSEIMELKSRYNADPEAFRENMHHRAHDLIGKGKIDEAWKTLLQDLP
jgi:flavin reductase (DIM6/NTAB) family NADH-FMN oxidoreductase RutF